MTDALAPDLAGHAAYARVFQPGRLTLGFIAPLEAYPNAPWPTLADHAALARKVDALDFAAIWLRDVPFYDPSFGDVGQILDPMVYAGWLAAQTTRIAIGTAGIVLPLRDPLIVAKQAASVDQLAGGRFLLGLSTGDRPSEFAAFDSDLGNRPDRYRDAIDVIRAATEQSFARHASRHYGTLDGSIDLLPKPVGPRLPILAIGRAGQTLEWLGENTDGWIWHLSDPRRLPDVLTRWRVATAGRAYKPFGYGAMFDLLADPDAPLAYAAGGIRSGRNALIELWKRQRDEGVAHVALNPKPSRRPFADVADELATHVLPHFPTDAR
ncbi:luciferase-type oxidoreductase [Sphingomonas sp. PP-CE-3G-477]|uniref:LLM class oxidoreductase n=1 Tax=Sphingomonas sp. PP-CE-3G-477 TaxID=2135660 RepID=UPI000D367CA8|nr:LLM class oxidoreductase [Sphingomonas sp. PP-CE-3G-477]PTQ66178.1 luciferase-type oxidoreductase [Sphingomonas sp. PP-CE-3G-477]